MVIFNGSFSGTGKESGKPYFAVKLIEVVEKTEDGRRWLDARESTFFTESFDVSAFSFGDLVKPKFTQSEFLSDRQRLTGLDLVAKSPYWGK